MTLQMIGTDYNMTIFQATGMYIKMEELIPVVLE